MATLRTRLTVAYGLALVGGLIVFAVALYSVRAASGVDALGPMAQGEGDRILTQLRAAVLNGIPLTVERSSPDSFPAPTVADSTLLSPSDGMLSIVGRMPGYYIIYDRDGRQLYSSIGIRQLPPEDRAAIGIVSIASAKGKAEQIVEMVTESPDAFRMVVGNHSK